MPNKKHKATSCARTIQISNIIHSCTEPRCVQWDVQAFAGLVPSRRGKGHIRKHTHIPTHSRTRTLTQQCRTARRTEDEEEMTKITNLLRYFSFVLALARHASAFACEDWRGHHAAGVCDCQTFRFVYIFNAHSTVTRSDNM